MLDDGCVDHVLHAGVSVNFERLRRKWRQQSARTFHHRLQSAGLHLVLVLPRRLRQTHSAVRDLMLRPKSKCGGKRCAAFDPQKGGGAGTSPMQGARGQTAKVIKHVEPHLDLPLAAGHAACRGKHTGALGNKPNLALVMLQM